MKEIMQIYIGGRQIKRRGGGLAESNASPKSDTTDKNVDPPLETQGDIKQTSETSKRQRSARGISLYFNGNSRNM